MPCGRQGEGVAVGSVYCVEETDPPYRGGSHVLLLGEDRLQNACEVVWVSRCDVLAIM